MGKSIEYTTPYPQYHLNWDYDKIWYLINYTDGDCKSVKLDKSDYRKRVEVMGWEKSMYAEIEGLANIYDKYCTLVDEHYVPKEDECIMTKDVILVWEDGKKHRCEGYVAQKYKELEESRLHLHDLIWRLVSCSPFSKWVGDYWFKYEDLHNSLFIEADVILSSPDIAKDKRISKIYYLTHFTKANKNIRNAFSPDGVYGEETLYNSVEDDLHLKSSWFTSWDLFRFWVINDVEFDVLLLREMWYTNWYISTLLWIYQDKIDDMLKKMRDKVVIYLRKIKNNGEDRLSCRRETD